MGVSLWTGKFDREFKRIVSIDFVSYADGLVILLDSHLFSIRRMEKTPLKDYGTRH